MATIIATRYGVDAELAQPLCRPASGAQVEKESFTVCFGRQYVGRGWQWTPHLR
jgi:hypothetical protein